MSITAWPYAAKLLFISNDNWKTVSHNKLVVSPSLVHMIGSLLLGYLKSQMKLKLMDFYLFPNSIAFVPLTTHQPLPLKVLEFWIFFIATEVSKSTIISTLMFWKLFMISWISASLMGDSFLKLFQACFLKRICYCCWLNSILCFLNKPRSIYQMIWGSKLYTSCASSLLLALSF